MASLLITRIQTQGPLHTSNLSRTIIMIEAHLGGLFLCLSKNKFPYNSITTQFVFNYNHISC